MAFLALADFKAEKNHFSFHQVIITQARTLAGTTRTETPITPIIPRPPSLTQRVAYGNHRQPLPMEKLLSVKAQVYSREKQYCGLNFSPDWNERQYKEIKDNFCLSEKTAL